MVLFLQNNLVGRRRLTVTFSAAMQSPERNIILLAEGSTTTLTMQNYARTLKWVERKYMVEIVRG